MTLRSRTRPRTLAPLAALAALSLSACATAPGPHITGSGQCHAEPLAWAVGKPADEANMRALLKQSGAGLINPIGPETITSRDYRPDRLRVFIDKANIITSVQCG
ncbi:I78 family peptidase inhibitor [Stenotrophomonas sp. NPDC077464]|uniref:I78 family peptidase inhibitor n=1 Tax=unclassified Stenotrophomonas TaxID=196198 RepID=UPI0037D43151